MKSVNMKFFAFILITLTSSNLLFGQNISDKRTQAGLTLNYGLNSLRMETSKIKSNGLGSDLGVGILIHTCLKNSKNLGFAYGLEFEFGTYKFKPEITTFYSYNDKEILAEKNSSNSTGTFQLIERTQKPIYVTVPLMFLFRTDFIGDIRYFGKFGVRNSFLVGNKMNDLGNNLTTLTQNTELLNMKSSGETFFYNGSIGMTVGAEWNFIGSTSLVAEAGYFYGITPLFLDRKTENKSLFTLDNFASPTYYSNKAKLSQFMFKVSILF